MKQMIKASILLMILIFSIKGSRAQSASKKPQVDMAKVNRKKEQVRQKVAEQQSQLQYLQTSPPAIPAAQNPVTDTSAIVRNRKVAVKLKEK